ncbi:MAG TPA: glycosyltransferase, partial [Gemmatimonadales bacterium]|nr:glycosyltransferase [Gemmatimonadales bacterium]
MTVPEKTAGVTIIVLTHDRPGALRALLAGLLQQQLEGREMELLVCNNSSRNRVSDFPLTRTGRLLGRFKDVKVFNSSYNWLCRVRYSLAMLARHDVVMFLDDDLT